MVLTSDAKQRARAKRLAFDLNWRDIQQRIEMGICELTGIKFDLTQPRAWNSPSIDRADPSQGYTKANVRVVLYAINVMSSDWGTEMIGMIADALRARRK